MTADPFRAYLAGLERPWQRQLAQQVVDCIRGFGPFEETIKWGHPHFAHHTAAIVKLYTATGWINVYFYRGTDLHDPTGLLLHDDNQRMKKARFGPEDALNVEAFADLLRQARQLNTNCNRLCSSRSAGVVADQ